MTRRPYSPVSPAERAQMIRLYTREGRTLRDVAKETRRAYNTVWTILRTAPEVTIRRPGDPRAVRRPVTPAERAAIVRLYRDEGKSVPDVGRELRRGSETVRRTLAEEKVRLRKIPPVSSAERATIIRMSEEGMSAARIGRELGRGSATVARILDEAQIPRNHRRGPAIRTRHWCGEASRHRPHIGCNGFGQMAGAWEELCTRSDRHPPHRSCDGRGHVPPQPN